MLILSLIVGLCGLFIFWILKVYFKRHDSFWTKRGVERLNSNISIIDLLSGRKSPPDVDRENYKDLIKRGEKYGGSVVFGKPQLFLADLDLVKTIMVKDFDHFTDHRHFIQKDPIFSKLMFFLNGEQWRSTRNLLSPTFTSGKIKKMFNHFDKSVNKLIDYIEIHSIKKDDGYETLVVDVMSRFTLDVITGASFGIESDVWTEKKSRLYEMSMSMGGIKILVKMALLGLFPTLSDFFGLKVWSKSVQEFFNSLIRDTLGHRLKSGEEREDFLQIMLDTKSNPAKLKIPENIAVGQAMAFFFGGFDTTANVLGQAIYLLAAHPHIQEKIFEEISHHMDQSNNEDKTINYDSVNSLEYLEKFLSEVLRMYPSFGRIERTCTKAYKIPETDVVIPEGTIVVIPVDAIHYDAKYYENPESFDVERFSADKKAQRNPYSFLPFGLGPRGCIGMRFAQIVMKVAISSLVYHFNIQPISGKTKIPVEFVKEYGFIRTPMDLELMMVKRRHN